MIAFLLIFIWLFLVIKLKFWRQATYITFFLLFLTFLALMVSSLKFYKEYVELGDNVDVDPYNYLTAERPYYKENNIVIVNIGNLNRRDIARQLSIISKCQPKVIGIDAYFNCEGRIRDSINCPLLLDTLGNQMLQTAIRDAGNVVLVSKLLWKTQTIKDLDLIDVYDSIEFSDNEFTQHAKSGYADVITTEESMGEFKEVDSFYPFYKINSKQELAFSTLIALQFDSIKTNKFLRSLALNESYGKTYINFRYNISEGNYFLNQEGKQPVLAYDTQDILNGNFKPGELKDKIVLMGYLGEFFGDANGLRGKYFTPLNTKPAGRATPDMHGIVLHANIISMILNEDYIDEQPVIESMVINFWICLLHIAILLSIRNHFPKYFDVVASLVIIFQIVLISLIRKELFYLFNYRLYFDASIFTFAIAGVAINIYLELVPWIKDSFQKVLLKVRSR